MHVQGCPEIRPFIIILVHFKVIRLFFLYIQGVSGKVCLKQEGIKKNLYIKILNVHTYYVLQLTSNELRLLYVIVY